MKQVLEKLPYQQVTLNDRRLLERREANRAYMMRLDNDSMLLNYRMEAGYPRAVIESLRERYGGWEDPTCQLRGHFLGHWLSAAAMLYAATGDGEVRAKANAIVADLANCQKENGGEWAASIPEKYLYWIGSGKRVWAPQYTIHKTMMGLMDMYRYARNSQALDIMVNWAKWFTRWTQGYTREEFDQLLDVETGGMLEVWADLYEATGAPEHRALMDTYYRGRLFEPLLAGKDVLTNMHANTTIPEALGAARAFEVTGEPKWLDIAKAYWDCAVDQRGQYATGGNTCGEVWTPRHELSARLGDRNQEHCVVYNMMRLADFLLRWTGDKRYADYWEMGLYNGVMAQGYWKGRFDHGRTSQHPHTGLLTYYLGLRSGTSKAWCSETQHFFCCHGTLVQANAAFNDTIFYRDSQGVAVMQYFAAQTAFEHGGAKVELVQDIETLAGSTHSSATSSGYHTVTDLTARYPHDPRCTAMRIKVEADRECNLTLRIRLPWWLEGDAQVSVNGQPVQPEIKDGFLVLARGWHHDEVAVNLKRKLNTWPLPDDPDTVAFLDGPILLAGQVAEGRMLAGDPKRAETMITPDCEREWSEWRGSFRTLRQEREFRLLPIYDIGYEPYAVYFPVKPRQ